MFRNLFRLSVISRLDRILSRPISMDALKQATLINIQRDFFDSLTTNTERNRQLLLSYFEKVSSFNLVVPEIDSSRGYSWFNIPSNKKHLTLREDYYDKVTIIDFFTYCCINCMHIIPTLSAIEEKYGHTIGALGVHSAKFDNEKIDENLAAAIERLLIKHPVVSDDMTIWSSMKVRCWPTVLLLGPQNKLLMVLTGEYYVNKHLDFFIQVALEYFNLPQPSGSSSLPEDKNTHLEPAKSLKFPSTVKYSRDGKYFAVADAGNNRVVIVDAVTHKVSRIIGSGMEGFTDGLFTSASLNSPQGLDWISSDEIIIADTRNHAIRLANISNETVKTIADIRKITQSPVSRYSPWDCTLWPPDKLLISMAGNHQIWLMCLSPKGVDPDICDDLDDLYSVAPFVGSGREENRNNTYRRRAGLAQPSGMFLDEENELLYFADSESSSVRIIDLKKDAAVSRLIGGAMDPMNLFEFGDTTGRDWEVKLQHPLGVVYSAKRKSVIVADTYNHKLKEINPVDKVCTGIPIILKEPAGLTVSPDGNKLLVCNTNDHSLLFVDVDALTSSPCVIDFTDAVNIASSSTGAAADHQSQVDSSGSCPLIFPVNLTKKISFNVTMTTESDLKLNSDAPSSLCLQVVDSSDVQCVDPVKVPITNLSSPIDMHAQLKSSQQFNKSPIKLKIIAIVYLCSKSEGTCFRKQETIDVTVSPIQDDSATNQIHLTYKITV